MANYDKSTGNNGTLRMSITYSQNVANNQTTFTVKYYLINTNSATYFTNVSWSGNTAGTNRSGTVSISGSGTKTLGSWTVTKTHNADGTLPAAARTFSISLSATGTSGVGGPTSNSVTLSIPTIPRKSSTGETSYSVTANGTNSVSVGITRHSPSFTHTVRFTLGAATHSITGVGTSTTWVVPRNWINQIPNATSRAGSITLTTYSGSTNLGSTSVPFTVRVPTDEVPSVGTVTLTRNNKDTPAAWNEWIQGHSAAEIEVVGATGGQGANVSTIKTVVGSWTKWGSQVSFDISGHGVLNFVTTVTDTRGRTASVTNSITVTPYTDLTISSVEVTRGYPGQWDFVPDQDGGTWGAIKPQFTYSSLAGKNVPKLSLSYKSAEGRSWTTAYTNHIIAPGEYEVFGAGSLSLDSAYYVEVTISDQFGSRSYQGSISTAFATMDFMSGGHGIAFGKVSTIPDTFELDFDFKANKAASFDDTVAFNSDVDVTGTTTLSGPLNVLGLSTFTDPSPRFEVTSGSHTVSSATSWSEYPITLNNDTSVTLTRPTWYMIYFRAWIYITGGIGEHRIGISLSGATTRNPSTTGWGDVIRQCNVGAGTRDELNLPVLLNPGTTVVHVEGYKTGPNSSAVHTLNYQSLRVYPMYPGQII